MNQKTTIKFVITLVLIMYILHKFDLNAIYQAFLEINVYMILLTVPFVVLMYFIRTQKWNILLDSINLKVDFYEALKIVLIGTFYGALTPGRVGEVSRSFYLDAEKSKTIPTVIIDRILDIFCLLLMSIIAIFMFFSDIYFIYLTIFAGILFSIGIIFCLNEKTIVFIFKIFKRSEASKQNYIETTKNISGNKHLLLQALALTFMYYIANMFVYWIVLKALDPMLNNIIVFSLPIIIILSNIPISISGLGIREFVCITIFEMLNENPVYGFSFSIILYLLTILFPGLVGGLFIAKK